MGRERAKTNLVKGKKSVNLHDGAEEQERKEYGQSRSRCVEESRKRRGNSQIVSEENPSRNVDHVLRSVPEMRKELG